MNLLFTDFVEHVWKCVLNQVGGKDTQPWSSGKTHTDNSSHGVVSERPCVCALLRTRRGGGRPCRARSWQLRTVGPANLEAQLLGEALRGISRTNIQCAHALCRSDHWCLPPCFSPLRQVSSFTYRHTQGEFRTGRGGNEAAGRRGPQVEAVLGLLCQVTVDGRKEALPFFLECRICL